MTTENEDITTEVDDVSEETSGLTPEQALALVPKLRREAAKHRTEKQEAKALAAELQKYKDAEKTELERVAERAEKAERELNELRREKLARAAAKTAGLDSEWVDLVQGNTEEELLESAKALAERVGKKDTSAPFNSSGGQPVRAPENANAAFRNFLLNANQ